MKTAPVVRELRRRAGKFEHVLVHTGQHYDPELWAIFVEELELEQPRFDLGVGSGSHTQQVGRTVARLEPVLRHLRPDFVIVSGDVNSTLGAALAAANCGVPVAHVEAGLRSFDETMPEEVNRRVVDHLSGLLFTHSPEAGDNLVHEGVEVDAIHYVGNTMIDTLVAMRPRIARLAAPARHAVEPREYVLVTLHRPPLVDTPLLGQALRALEEVGEHYRVLFPMHPRTRAAIAARGLAPRSDRVRLLDPLGYLDFIGLLECAAAVVTDSGGVQEEAAFLGIPCYTLRDRTERPITVEVGSNTVLGLQPARIVELPELIAASRGHRTQVPPLWDGHASVRIVDVLESATAVARPPASRSALERRRAGRELHRRVTRPARSKLRRGVKQLAANALHRTGARRGLARACRRAAGGTRVLIVGYHRVVPDFEAMRDRVIPALLTSVATFEKQLMTLAASYRFVPLTEALAVLDGGSSSDRDLCVVTFDDGYADFAEHALPVLRQLGIPTTLYVATAHVGGSAPLLHDRLYRLLRVAERAGIRASGFHAPELEPALTDALRSDPAAAVDRLLERWSRAACLNVAETLEHVLDEDPAAALGDSPLLQWDDLRAVRSAGVEIGAHTVDHACLSNESPTEIARQVRSPKERLENELGAPVLDFAYPNGWYSPQVADAVREAGYRSAVTTEDRLNRRGQNPVLLRRKIVWEFTSRGLSGFSTAVAACNFDNAFGVLGLAHPVSGARPDASVPA